MMRHTGETMSLKQILTNWKTIVSSIAITLPLLVWAHDTRYLTSHDLTKHSINKLYDEIAVLEIKKGIAKPREMQLIDMSIALKVNRIDKLRED